MPSPVQAHSKAIFRDSVRRALVNSPTPMYLQFDGDDVVFSATLPEQLAFYRLESGGDYVLLDVTRRAFIVYDGSDLTIDDVGPAVAIFVATEEDIVLSTDLSLEPVADLYYDPTGDLWVVPRTSPRLHAAQVGADIYLY
jgi:hypothetical protein